jgi:hypothetical protein
MLGVGPLRRPHLVGDALPALLGHDGGGQRPSALWEWDVTTDQLRTTMAELSALQRSAMDTSDKWFALDTRRGPIWGSRGREFKSCQPDWVKYLVRRQIHPSKYLYFMIVFAVDHLF